MSPLRTKIRFTLTLLATTTLMSCVSTQLDNNLGTTVTGQGNQLVFAWDDDHPFAVNYQRDPITVVAEYVEVDVNGNRRNVRQYLTPQRQRYPNNQQVVNRRTFQLLTQLPSTPAVDSPICLYMESQRNVVPIRDPSLGETARFQFPSWEQQIRQNTVNRFAQRDLSTARNNVSILKQQLTGIERQFKNSLIDFNEQLRQEPLENGVSIARPSQCPLIQLDNSIPPKPFDVLPSSDIPFASQRVCSLRTYNGLNYGDGTVHALVLAYIAVGNDKRIFAFENVEQARKKDFATFIKIFGEHNGVVSKDEYKPELGKKEDYMRLSSHAVSMQSQAAKALLSESELTEQDIKAINQVLAAELDVFFSCVSEGEQQLVTKSVAWEKRVAAIPERVIAREAFLQQRCETLFTQAKQDERRTDTALQDAETELAKVEAYYADAQSTSANTQTVETLNTLSCQL